MRDEILECIGETAYVVVHPHLCAWNRFDHAERLDSVQALWSKKMTTPSIDTLEFREKLWDCVTLTNPHHAQATERLVTFIDAKIAAAVKAERDEWIAQLKLLEKKPA